MTIVIVGHVTNDINMMACVNGHTAAKRDHVCRVSYTQKKYDLQYLNLLEGVVNGVFPYKCTLAISCGVHCHVKVNGIPEKMLYVIGNKTMI